MTRGHRLIVAHAAIGLLLLGACGDDPPTSPDAGPVTLVPADGSASPSAEPTSPADEDVLEGLARDVTDQQRPGEFEGVANITIFDDPEGCESGEAAFVTVDLSGEPTPGEILFCRIDAQPGWKLSQGILYGE
jgi:hypothetical protein